MLWTGGPSLVLEGTGGKPDGCGGGEKARLYFKPFPSLFFIFLFSFENVEGQLTNAPCIVYIFIYWCRQEGQVCGWRDLVMVGTQMRWWGADCIPWCFFSFSFFFLLKIFNGEGQLTKPPCLFSLGPVTAVGS